MVTVAQETNKIEVLTEAISESFENLAFAPIEEFQTLTHLPELEKGLFWTSIVIESPSKARISMIAKQNTAVQLCESTLGEENIDSSDHRVTDVFREFLNTIAGCFLRKLSADKEILEIGLPHFGITSSDAPKSFGENMSCLLEFRFNDEIIYMVYS